MIWTGKSAGRVGASTSGTWRNINSNPPTFESLTGTVPSASSRIADSSAAMRRRRRKGHDNDDERDDNAESDLVNRARGRRRRLHPRVHSTLAGTSSSEAVLHVFWRTVLVPAHLGPRVGALPPGTHLGAGHPRAWSGSLGPAGRSRSRNRAAAAQES